MLPTQSDDAQPPARTNPLLEVWRALWAWLSGTAERRIKDSDEGVG
jgi:hypothetical protein